MTNVYAPFFLLSISFSNHQVIYLTGPDHFYKVTISQLLRLPLSTLPRADFLNYI